eukprot:UN17707
MALLGSFVCASQFATFKTLNLGKCSSHKPTDDISLFDEIHKRFERKRCFSNVIASFQKAFCVFSKNNSIST